MSYQQSVWMWMLCPFTAWFKYRITKTTFLPGRNTRGKRQQYNCTWMKGSEYNQVSNKLLLFQKSLCGEKVTVSQVTCPSLDFPNARDTWIYWSKSHEGPEGWWRDWSIWHTRERVREWGCSPWRGEGSGVLSKHINTQWEGYCQSLLGGI